MITVGEIKKDKQGREKKRMNWKKDAKGAGNKERNTHN